MDGAERIKPLPLGSCGTLKKRNVLNRETEQVGNIDQEMFLVALKRSRNGRADSEQPDWSLLAGHTDQHNCRDVFRFHPPTSAGIRGGARGNEQCFLIKQSLEPGFAGRNFLVLLQKSFAETKGRANDSVCRILPTVKKKHESVACAKAFDQMAKNAFERFADPEGLRGLRCD